MVEDYWEASKQMLMDGTFLDSLRSYDKDHIDPAIIKRIKVGTLFHSAGCAD
jgi:dynein heavy chain